MFVRLSFVYVSCLVCVHSYCVEKQRKNGERERENDAALLLKRFGCCSGGLRITWFCARTARALGRLPASLTWLSRHSEVISTLNAVAGELLNEEEERANELQRELNDRRETEVEGSAKSDAEKGRGSKGEQHSKEDDQVDGRDGIFASRCGAAEMMRESLALPQKERPAAKASAQQKKGKEPRAAFEETEARVRRKVKEEEVTAGRAASEVLRELGLCSRALALSSEALKVSLVLRRCRFVCLHRNNARLFISRLLPSFLFHFFFTVYFVCLFVCLFMYVLFLWYVNR